MRQSRSRWRKALRRAERRVMREVKGAQPVEAVEPVAVSRDRLITPWETYLIEDQQSLDRHTIVWEVATIQWGLPAGVLAAGLALTEVASRTTVSLSQAIGLVGSIMFGVVVLAHVVGRVLWRLGLRSGRGVG
jgi:hypothetical protein